jgi:hypothetical protein
LKLFMSGITIPYRASRKELPSCRITAQDHCARTRCNPKHNLL